MAPARPLRLLLLLLPVALLLPAARGEACPARLDAETLPQVPNGIEAGLGATNVNAAIGSGGLTATLSRCGEITSLRWPGPGGLDQLQYLTSNSMDARAQDDMGALPDMGAFAGLAWQGREDHGFTWLRDSAWRTEQSYTASTSDVVRTVHRNSALGLVVESDAFVLPESDVLVLRYRVRREPHSPVRRARLIFYANFAPSHIRLPWFPVGDTGLDYRNGFALLYDARRQAFLQFLPGEKDLGLFDLLAPNNPDFSLLDPILQHPPSSPGALEAEVEGAVDALTTPGIYLAFGARGGNSGFQAGFDDAPLCAHQSAIAERALGALGLPSSFLPLARLLFVCSQRVADPGGPLAACRQREGWTWQAENAYRDAADGELSGSPIAACQANAALSRDLDLRGGRAEATFYVAAARTRDEAFALLAQSRAAPSAEAQERATDLWWKRWLAPARLPATDDPDVLRFARRALISVRTATDRRSGAMVASVATQPPYGFDWPRDGAFLNYALDLAGYHDMVTRHNLLYAHWQRRSWSPWSIVYPFVCDPAHPSYPSCIPPGTWAMNYYADPDQAIPGGPFSFEIDTTGLAVWTLWEHAHFLEDPATRNAYLAQVCPAIALGAAALAGCHDPADPDPRLQCLANEDDNQALTQGLQGAETTLLALKSAIAAAGDCGFAPQAVDGWKSRRDELQTGILADFLKTTPEPDFQGPRFVGARAAWVIWPTKLLPFGDPRMGSQADFLTLRSVDPILERTAPTLGYNAENMLARAQLARALGDGAALAQIRDQVRFFVRQGTTAGTGHMAEFAGRVPVDVNGDGRAPDYLPENDVPHVWQQATLYSTAMLAFGSRAPAPGCDRPGCGASADPPAPQETRCGLLGIEVLLPLAVAEARRRRRRPGAEARHSGGRRGSGGTCG